MSDQATTTGDYTPIERLSRDLRNAAKTLTDTEARFLVDAYYIAQENRIRQDAQIRSMSEAGEPCEVLEWLSKQSGALENQIKGALDKYSGTHPVGEWARSIKGVGPVIAAGLLAHIDITKAPTAGHIWRFAGLDPTAVWEKGKKRPHNAALKTLCWKLGESFVKVSGYDDDVYGKVYIARKAVEQANNEAGAFADQAADILARKRIGRDTEAYKHYSAGRLPPGHIHARAKRYAVKLFLSHLHDKWYRKHFGKAPPLPYPIAHLGHAHYVAPPE